MGREEKNEVSKERILKAALEEFGQNDYNVASTNTICKNHGISKGLLFHYYKSKDEIFLVCVEKCFEELSDYLQKNYKKIGNKVEDILNYYFEMRFNFFREFPHYAQIFKTATFNAPTQLRDEIKQLKMTLRQVNEGILLDVLDDLDLKEDVSKDQVIHLVLEFTEYLIVKSQEQSNVLMAKDTRELFEEQNEQLIQMIKMLFYGIIK